MIVRHREFEIEVERESCSSLIHFSVIRLSDGYLLDENFVDSNDTIRDHVMYLIKRVDEYIETGEE